MGDPAGRRNYYFAGLKSYKELKIEGLADGNSNDSSSLDDEVKYINILPGAKVLGFHAANAKVPDLMSGSNARKCIQPMQSWNNNSFLILPSADLTGKEEALGMQSCGVINDEG